MNPLCFGLTGGVASGKTTVAKRISARGIPVIDADDVAREATREGTQALSDIVRTFGADATDRKKLALMVFSDKTALQKLEEILHPIIAELSQKHINKLHAAGHPVVAYDAALLIEAGEAEKFRPLVVVWAPEHEQIARAMMNRGWAREDISARMQRQMPPDEKRTLADYVIENDKDLASLYARTDEVIDAILTKAGYDPGKYDSWNYKPIGTQNPT